MENFRENNYGYPLPAAVIRLIEEFEEDEDAESMECLGKILDQCDHTDLKLLRDYEKLSQLIEDYIEMLNDPDILLTKFVSYIRFGRC